MCTCGISAYDVEMTALMIWLMLCFLFLPLSIDLLIFEIRLRKKDGFKVWRSVGLRWIMFCVAPPAIALIFGLNAFAITSAIALIVGLILLKFR